MDMLGKEITLPNDQDGHLMFGPLDLWIHRRPGEWRMAYREDAGQETRPGRWDATPAPEDAEWERWVTGNGATTLILRPVTPDRAVVVRPEMPVRLRPGQSTDFFVGVPLWIEVSIGAGKASEPLREFPSMRLSSTWFGTPVEGELCYSLRTHAHRSPEDLAMRQHRCICPLQVKNSSDEVLSFERICLRCQYLSVYRGATRFWSNAVRLSYRGKQEWSRVVYGRNPPEESGAGELVSPPRRQGSKGFALRSFQSAMGMGGIA